MPKAKEKAPAPSLLYNDTENTLNLSSSILYVEDQRVVACPQFTQGFALGECLKEVKADSINSFGSFSFRGGKFLGLFGFYSLQFLVFF
jgi:hypothetical protein